MKNPLARKNILLASAALFMFVVLLLVILPPEQSLGHVIKAVYVHAALVQTGLLIFMAAGLLGLISLLSGKKWWMEILCAFQKTGIVIWSIYILSSTIVTFLAWGVWIAWEEPRVIISIVIWLTALLFFALVVWIKSERFTAGANIVLGAIAFWLTKATGVIRHPLDPIGSSDSIFFKILFIFIFALTILLAIQLSRLFIKKL